MEHNNETLDLADTRIAFSRLSNADLNKSYLMFKALSLPAVVQWGPKLAELVLKLKLPFRGLIKSTVFKQFCGGESIKDCSATMAKLHESGVGSILDYASEGFVSDADFDRTLREALESIEFARKRPDWIPFCVFKPTGIASIELMAKVSRNESLSPAESVAIEKAKGRFRQLCQAAVDAGVRLFVDAEESWIQPYIDALVEEAMTEHNKEKALIFTTYQMYRRDRYDHLVNFHQEAKKKGYKVGVKLVRGAYLEKETLRALKLGIPNPVFDKKSDTDDSYNRALKYMMEHIEDFGICAGTHNEQSTRLLAELVDVHSISRKDSRIHFAQLLGMSDHLTFNLAAAGYSSSKYVPYGPIEDVLPYLSRRAQENSSVQGQTGRELELLSHERFRRKTK